MSDDGDRIRLCLCGDVMTGRGVDQILPHPGRPEIHESYMRDSRGYVEIAEQRNGPIPLPVEPGYVWGDALRLLRRADMDLRIINLETSVTVSEDWWPGKGIHYRMHPRNIDCLLAGMIDCCVLANNHVLDWGYAGLEETLATLHAAGISTAGAGRSLDEARSPAVLESQSGIRILVFAYGSATSGIPREWAAGPGKPGLGMIRDRPRDDAAMIGRDVAAHRRPEDIVIVSVHWGGNWGYEIARDQQTLARLLVETADVDIVHGHSSHHPRAFEVHRGKLILYGCGDLLNDYEGISGHEAFRPELSLLYVASLDAATGTLAGLEMHPMRIERMRLREAGRQDSEWLAAVLTTPEDETSPGIAVTESGALTLSSTATEQR